MTIRKITAAALGGLIASAALSPSAQATGDVWVEGSYEYLALPDVRFSGIGPADVVGNTTVQDEFRNNDGEFDGFRIDGGIDNISIMGGAYVMGVKGFFAWHDEQSELQCNNSLFTGPFCAVSTLFDDPNNNEGLTGGPAGGGTSPTLALLVQPPPPRPPPRRDGSGT